MDAEKIHADLTALKDKAIRASRDNDRDFYDGYLDDTALAVTPQGTFTKSEVLASMTGERAPFSAKRIENTSVRALGPDAGVVTYIAVYERDGQETAVATTTVYECRDGVWKGIFYQQTPQPNPAPASRT